MGYGEGEEPYLQVASQVIAVKILLHNVVIVKMGQRQCVLLRKAFRELFPQLFKASLAPFLTMCAVEY